MRSPGEDVQAFVTLFKSVLQKVLLVTDVFSLYHCLHGNGAESKYMPTAGRVCSTKKKEKGEFYMVGRCLHCSC